MSDNFSILVADAEPILRNQLVRILESEGYNVTSVSTVVELHEQSKAAKFNLLLLDLRITGLSSIEVLRELRANFPELAIVVLIAANEAFMLKEALKNGADEYIIKPYKCHEVSLIIKRTYWRLLSIKETGKAFAKT
jgi:DNA-binding response OmpR family regulator